MLNLSGAGVVARTVWPLCVCMCVCMCAAADMSATLGLMLHDSCGSDS